MILYLLGYFYSRITRVLPTPLINTKPRSLLRHGVYDHHTSPHRVHGALVKGYSEFYRYLHHAFRFINEYFSCLQIPIRWRPLMDRLCVCQWKWKGMLIVPTLTPRRSPQGVHPPIPGEALVGVLKFGKTIHWTILRFADNQLKHATLGGRFFR